GPGQHVLDKALVAGHVDDAEPEIPQIEDGEADVDGDAPGFLLRQAVAVDAGQGFDERGLAVVDVAGGAGDQVAGHNNNPSRTGVFQYCPCPQAPLLPAACGFARMPREAASG